jgi:hypothetical protein
VNVNRCGKVACQRQVFTRSDESPDSALLEIEGGKLMMPILWLGLWRAATKANLLDGTWKGFWKGMSTDDPHGDL